MAWEYDAADGSRNGNPGKVLRTAPAVDSQGERPAYTGVVEGLHEMVGSDEENAIPVARLERDLVPQGVDQIVKNFGREAAELDQRLPAADGFYAGRLLFGEDGPEAVQIGLARVMVVGVAPALDEGPGFVLHEDEGPGAEDMLLVPVYVLGELLRIVDKVEGVGHGRDKGGRGIFQREDHRVVVRRVDLIHHTVEGLPRAVDARRGEDNLVEGGHDVVRGHRLAVPE